jgi:hypothetical protein
VDEGVDVIVPHNGVVLVVIALVVVGGFILQGVAAGSPEKMLVSRE